MEISKSVVLCGLLALLSGCVTGNPPTKPPAGDIVTVKFENLGGNLPVLTLFKDDYDCYGEEQKLFVNNPEREMLIERKPYLTVHAEWIDFFMMPGTMTSTTCTVTLTVPTDGADEFLVGTLGDHTSCAAQVDRKGIDGSYIRVSAIPREKYDPLIASPIPDLSGPYCQGDVAYQGSSLFVSPRGPSN